MNGNLTSDGTNTYVWNGRDQLVSMTGPGLTASFQYDAFGNRISKTVNGSTITYLYDGANLVQEQSGGSPSANILAGALDEIFTRTDAAGAWSPLFDGLGSTLALADSTGTVQTQYTYDPFGKTATSGSVNGNTSQYTGRENDGTGLYYYRARYYSPSLQRFISEDPIGLLGGINLYAYAGNNPMSFTDPLGLKPKGPANDSEGNADGLIAALENLVQVAKQNLRDMFKNAALEAAGPAMAVVASRALTAADLGLVGDVRQLRGTVSIADDVVTVRVDMIEGEIGNPFQILTNLAQGARAQGANTLRIEGNLANERLYNALVKRYGMTTVGGVDVITIPLR